MDIWQSILEFEPFLRLLGIKAELLGPDYVVLRLPVRQELANHLGGLHGGAQFTLGEATAQAAAVLSLGEPLDQVAVLHQERDNYVSKVRSGGPDSACPRSPWRTRAAAPLLGNAGARQTGRSRRDC
jgi:uncharacterized protein (TIGR00369 family)